MSLQLFKTLWQILCQILYTIKLTIKQYFYPPQTTNAQHMKLVLGIGNPSKIYENTRHNIGKMFIDYIIKKYSLRPHKTSPKYSTYIMGDTIIAKSEVFMNLSAQALEGIMKSYPGLTIQSTIVVLDDLDHKLGNARIKKAGSAEGHRGATSIMGRFKTQSLNRLQLGIDRPISRDPDEVADYVLKQFKRNELEKVSQMFKKGGQLLKSEGYLG